MGNTYAVAPWCYKIIILLALLTGPTACLYTVEETASQNIQQTADATQSSAPDAPAGSVDPFLETIASLEAIGFYKQPQDCSYPLDSGYCCEIPPTENNINKWIELTNQDFRRQQEEEQHLLTNLKKEIEPLNLQDLLEIKQCFVKADYEVQDKMYPRATVEEWTFAAASSASRVARQLTRLNKDEWYHISKTPISWWRKGNRIYFIYPGGHFALTEVPKLKQKMKENI